MNSNILKSKYRLLVLVDETKSSNIALSNAVNVAKTVGAEIEIFCVKSPTQLVKQDNQIAVMRALSAERVRAKKAMQQLVNTISEEEKIPVIYNFTFGNVIDEVQKHIDKTQPDMIVIGKRKSKLVSFLGDGLTSYLLKNHSGGILISGDERTLISGKDVSIGFLEDVITKNKGGIAEDLKKNSDKPLKLFKINDALDPSKEQSIHSQENGNTESSNTVIFEFDNGKDVSNNVSKYIEKSKVSLLCVEKSMLFDFGNSVRTITNQLQKTITKTNIPVLVLAN